MPRDRGAGDEEDRAAAVLAARRGAATRRMVADAQQNAPGPGVAGSSKP